MKIVYWSGTGNTEAMAEGIAKGIKESGKVSGKKAALFGSYGWGDGQWMRDFEERMTGYGCTIKLENLINENEADEDHCIKFGKQIALL